MNVKRVLIGLLIVIAIVTSVSAASAGLFDGLFGEEQKDNVIEIDNISFNTTNVTKFTLYNESVWDGGSYKWYMDENKTGYNIHIYNIYESEDIDWVAEVKGYKEDTLRSEVPIQTINGIAIYTVSANIGEHIGEPRYIAFIENYDLKTIVDVWSPDPNETAKMASTLKFK